MYPLVTVLISLLGGIQLVEGQAMAVNVRNCTGVPSECPDDIQSYLTQYGYLDPNMECDNFADDLKSALTRFQQLNLGFHGIEVVGMCDNVTVQVMDMPRCGCEDQPIKGKKMMPANIVGPQEYRVGNTMWSKKSLTWRVSKYPVNNRQLTQQQIDDAFSRALQIWANVTDLSFQKTSPQDTNSDINIRFETRRHTASAPYFDFDGRGKVLAHAFFPESGVVHFDDDENFVLNTNTGTELFIVAAHEFGHTLGISHSNINSALMAPYYRYSANLQLDPDDIAAIQSIYGPKRNGPRPTLPPPTLPPRPNPTTPSSPKPAYCSMKVDGTFHISGKTYVFTRERLANNRRNTFVYTVTRNGINPDSRVDISSLFVRGTSTTYRRRPHPYRVDAAAFIPSRRYVFLFTGTRAYRYTVSGSRFELDPGYPRWMDVTEFPERPRAAVAMPYSGTNRYYMLIFGKTMVWDWNLFTQKVGAWAYPISTYGRNMPLRVDSAFLKDSNTAVFIQGEKSYDFAIRYRRVLGADSVKRLATDFFKGRCN